MREEVCLFHKYGFCRNGDQCRKTHFKEICSNKECDSRSCNKRHPRPCRFFRNNDFCKFNSKCSFSHKLPKYVEDQNSRMELLERKTKNLEKQIDDQNEPIRELKKSLIENQKSELDKLRNQILNLKASNNEKEKAIKNLNERDGRLNKESEAVLETYFCFRGKHQYSLVTYI